MAPPESSPDWDVRPLVMFVVGGPGSGKGTQSTFLSDVYGYEHLSAGDLLRAEQNTGSELADMINGCIKHGLIVRGEVTVRLLKAAMKKSGKKKFLIDGFPRNADNLQTWFELMDEHVLLEGVLYLTCSEDAMRKRILERGKTSGRVDDNDEAIRKRFCIYRDATLCIVEHYAKLGKVMQVNADRDIVNISNDLRRMLRYQIVFVVGPSCERECAQCDRIVAKYPEWCHLRANHFRRKTSESQQQNGNGMGGDTEYHVRSLMDAMEQSGRRFILISGFPSQATELEAWNKNIDNLKFEVIFCLCLKQDDSAAEETIMQRTPEKKEENNTKNNIVMGSTVAVVENFVLGYPEMENKVAGGMQNIIAEKFRSEGLLRQVNISRESEAVCNDIDIHILSGRGMNGNEAQPERVLGT